MELLRTPEFVYGILAGAGGIFLIYNLKRDSLANLLKSRKNRNTIFASIAALIAYLNHEISGEQLILALGDRDWETKPLYLQR